MEEYGSIYCVTHDPTGRVYIGLTTESSEIRWERHKKAQKGYKFHNAIRKYGPEQFSLRTLATCCSKEALDWAEKSWIKLFRATDPKFGFNLKEGGAAGKLSPESREKLSRSLKGKKHRKHIVRVPMSEETKRKIGAANSVALKAAWAKKGEEKCAVKI